MPLRPHALQRRDGQEWALGVDQFQPLAVQFGGVVVGPDGGAWAGHHAPTLGVLAGEREHHRGGGGVRLDVGVAVPDRARSRGPPRRRVRQAGAASRRCRGATGAVGRRLTALPAASAPWLRSRASESRRLARNAAKISWARWMSALLPPGELFDAPVRGGGPRGPPSTLPAGHAAARPAAFHMSHSSVAHVRVGEARAARRRVHGRGLPRPSPRPSRGGPQPDTDEEHFLVQPDPAPADEHHSCDGGDERLRQIVDHHRGHAVQRGVHAPQRAAQQSLGLLDDRVAEVHVHQIVARPRQRQGRT